MADVDEIDDLHAVLVGLLPVQASSVLLERSFPGDRHRKNQGVERWVIEALTDQLARGEQDARCVGRQGLQIAQKLQSLLFLTYRPCRVNRVGTCRTKSAPRASRCSVRSVSTSTFRPWSNAARISADIIVVRPRR